MKLLVTGGCGFIGSNFIHYWLANHPKDTIVNLDALTYAGNKANLADIAKDKRYCFIHGNITDPKTVDRAIKDVETVVHFAAESHVDRSILEPAAFVKTNVLGTQVLLDAAREHKVTRFHHVSTDEVFGSLTLTARQKFSEKTPIDPHSPYSASKAASDLLVRAYGLTYGLPVTITNTSNNYGPYQFPEKLIPLMIINALHDQSLPVYGDGKNIRDWIHVEDHCRAIDLVLKKGKIGETYCVGGDSEQSNIDVVRQILKRLKKPVSLIKYVTDRPGHDRRYAIDSQKIKKELRFRQQHSFASGLAATVKWYVQNPQWWQPLLNPEFKQYLKKQYG